MKPYYHFLWSQYILLIMSVHKCHLLRTRQKRIVNRVWRKKWIETIHNKEFLWMSKSRFVSGWSCFILLISIFFASDLSTRSRLSLFNYFFVNSSVKSWKLLLCFYYSLFRNKLCRIYIKTRCFRDLISRQNVKWRGSSAAICKLYLSNNLRTHFLWKQLLFKLLLRSNHLLLRLLKELRVLILHLSLKLELLRRKLLKLLILILKLVRLLHVLIDKLLILLSHKLLLLIHLRLSKLLLLNNLGIFLKDLLLLREV